jgi:signal peptidase I
VESEEVDAAPQTSEDATPEPEDEAKDEPKGKSKRSAFKEGAILVVLAVLLYYLTLTFVARPYLIPSESMEPTLHGCRGCTGDRIMVDKVTYRFGSPGPGDVIVFKGPDGWNTTYQSIRSHNTAIRWVQNVLSVIGFVPPDENDLVKRVIAVGGQTVQCRNDTGLTVNGKPLYEPYLDPATIGSSTTPCWDIEFGPVTVPDGRLWVMGDNRTHSADSRWHCEPMPHNANRQMPCTGDPMAGTVPADNVIGKARFIAWPPSRWGGVSSVNNQQGQ